MKIILLRHTESEANFKKVYGGKKDFKLTQKGILQIASSVEILKNKYGLTNLNNARIFSSPLSRARNFAISIGESINKDVAFDKSLEELDFGIFEGYSYNELKDKKHYKLWCEDYFNYRIPEGESLMLLKKRVESFLVNILKNEDDDLIIVSHEGVIKIILLYLLELPIDNFGKFYCGNGSIIEIIYERGFAYIKNLENF